MFSSWFQKSDALVITKLDAAPFFSFQMERCMERVKKLNPDIQIFPVSAKTGEGMPALETWLRGSLKQWRTQSATAIQE